jgi:hypothetical protein
MAVHLPALPPRANTRETDRDYETEIKRLVYIFIYMESESERASKNKTK